MENTSELSTKEIKQQKLETYTRCSSQSKI